MTRKIIKTAPGDTDFHLFENFPHDVYSREELKLRLPESLNQNLLQACYLLLVDGNVMTRAALYHNPDLRMNNRKCFCIGNYEAKNDLTSSQELLTFIFNEAGKAGAQMIIGPMNGSTWDSYRFNLSYENLFFTESYHPLYYNDHFIQSGFRETARYFSAKDTKIIFDRPEILKRTKELTDAGIKLRFMDLDRYDEEIKNLYTFITTAFSTNHLYSPISWDYFKSKYSGMEKILDRDFIVIAEDQSNEPVGIFFCIPDLMNKREKSLVIKTIARKNEPRLAGLGQVMGNMIYRNVSRKNYTTVIHAFMYRQGSSVKTSEYFSGVPFKEYVLYLKELS